MLELRGAGCYKRRMLKEEEFRGTVLAGALEGNGV